ncbi:MAG: SPOR domain-containing protein [Calditrichaeota bacterium]|nr:SPOR domain-containing protein [Calditrichota bacterium]
MRQKNKWVSSLALIILAGILAGGCAGLQPPVRYVSDEQFEKGLTTSEQEFRKPIDILQGEWSPADSSDSQAESKTRRTHVQGNYFIQIISLSTPRQAKRFVRTMKKLYPQAAFFIRQRGKYWAVWVGRFRNRKDAQKALASTWVKKFPDAWVVHEK